MTQPKHAEVLRAIADGKEVEYSSIGYSKWYLLNLANVEVNPLSFPEYQWRIKPEVKLDTFIYSTARWDGSHRETGYSVAKSLHNLKLTFDGETHNLKDAEVIKG